MVEKQVIVRRDLSKPVTFRQRAAVVNSARQQGVVEIGERSAVVHARDWADPVQILGHDAVPTKVQKQITITVDGDLVGGPEWQTESGAGTRYTRIDNGVSTPDDFRFLSAWAHGTLSRFTLQNMPADFISCISVQAHVRQRLMAIFGAVQVGYILRLKDGAASVYTRSNSDVHVSPKNKLFSAGSCTLDKSSMDGLTLELEGDGISWPFGTGLVQLAEVDIIITYLGTP